MRRKELLISPSIFTLFIFLLVNKNWRESDFLLQDRIPKSIVKNLRKVGVKVVYMRLGDSLGPGILSKILQVAIRNLEYLRFLMVFKGDFNYDTVYGNDEVLYSIPFRKNGITLIEDGSFNWQPASFFEKRAKKIHRFLITRWLYGKQLYSYIPYGFNDQVKKIYLTRKESIDQTINNKVEVLSIKELWDSKTVDEKICIQSVFGLKTELISALTKYPNVLLTQPLGKGEGGFMSESEKVAIYSKLLNGTPLNKLLIKTHYTEKTDYRKYFRDALVVDQPIPFQFFEMFDYTPRKVITVSSSAALKFQNDPSCEIVFAGTEIDKRIIRMYGIIRAKN